MRSAGDARNHRTRFSTRPRQTARPLGQRIARSRGGGRADRKVAKRGANPTASSSGARPAPSQRRSGRCRCPGQRALLGHGFRRRASCASSRAASTVEAAAPYRSTQRRASGRAAVATATGALARRALAVAIRPRAVADASPRRRSRGVARVVRKQAAGEQHAVARRPRKRPDVPRAPAVVADYVHKPAAAPRRRCAQSSEDLQSQSSEAFEMAEAEATDELAAAAAAGADTRSSSAPPFATCATARAPTRAARAAAATEPPPAPLHLYGAAPAAAPPKAASPPAEAPPAERRRSGRDS